MRILQVTYAGHAYSIPEAWIMGAMRTSGGDIVAAVRVWHEQAILEAQFLRERACDGR